MRMLFWNETATPWSYTCGHTLSLHDALPFGADQLGELARLLVAGTSRQQLRRALEPGQGIAQLVRQPLERGRQRRRQRGHRILAGQLVDRMRFEQPAAAFERTDPHFGEARTRARERQPPATPPNLVLPRHRPPPPGQATPPAPHTIRQAH